MVQQVSSILPRTNRVAISGNLAVLFCPASNGKLFGVTIDRSDVERVLSSGFWHVANFSVCRGFKLYCYQNKKGGGVILLHRFLLKPPCGIFVDHAKHRTLDNRRSELRGATRSQNSINAHIRKDSRTGLRGVSPNPRRGNFRARIWVDGKRVSLGHFPTAELAGKAYDQAAKLHHGEFAFTNGDAR